MSTFHIKKYKLVVKFIELLVKYFAFCLVLSLFYNIFVH